MDNSTTAAMPTFPTVTKKFRSLGCDLNVQVPSTVEAFDTSARKVGACLEEAINNVVYRGVLAEFRDSFCEKVAEKTGIARRVKKTIKNTKGEDVEVLENEGDFIAYVRVQKGWTEDNKELQSIADDVASSLLFDASATERKAPTPKKLPKDYVEAATRFFTNGTQEKWASKFGLTLSGDQAKDIEAIGWKLKVDVEAQQKALLAAAV